MNLLVRELASYKNLQKVSATLPGLNKRHATSTTAAENVKPEPLIPKATPDLLVTVKRDTKKDTKIDLRANESVPFDDVPGPALLRGVSNLWTSMPKIACEVTVRAIQYLLKATTPTSRLFGTGGEKGSLFQRLFQTYGPVVRLHGPLGTDVVLLNKPEDAARALHSRDSHVRCYLDSVETYRRNTRRYKTSGPLFLTANLEEIRKVMDKTASISTGSQIKKTEEICNEFVNKLKSSRNKQEEMHTNLKIELYKCSLECLSSFAFNKKFGFLEGATLNPLSEPGRLLEGLVGATEAVRKCEYGIHLWKFFETPSFRNLTKNCDLIDSVLSKEVDRAMSSLKGKKERVIGFNDVSLVESLLLKEGVSEEDVMTTLLDLFLIGANSVSHIVCYILYYLARNPRCQIKLHEEAVKYSENMNETAIKDLIYANACIKECLRLDPPVPIVNRVLDKDVVINHYRIPKGTYVLFATHLNGGLDQYFEEPQRFKPERWLNDREGTYGNEYLSFACIPFGQGPKSGKIKEMARIQMLMLLVKILKKFRIEYNYGDSKNTNEFLSSPTLPMRFRFVDRNI